MSKLSVILSAIGFGFLFITIGIYDASIVGAIITFVLFAICVTPAIIEDRIKADNEYEMEVSNELNQIN